MAKRRASSAQGELPPFGALDANGDGVISREEFEASSAPCYRLTLSLVLRREEVAPGLPLMVSMRRRPLRFSAAAAFLAAAAGPCRMPLPLPAGTPALARAVGEAASGAARGRSREAPSCRAVSTC
jgi:hypothetical protein